MAQIKKHHGGDCTGADCACPWRLDYRPQGLAGPRKRIEFPTKKTAEKYLAETSVKVSHREYIEPAKIPTFAEVAKEWMADQAGCHPATLAGWRVHLKHLAPLDDLRLDRIDVALIERVRDDLRVRDGLRRGLGARTVGAILTTCRAAFKLATRRHYIARSEAALARRPRNETVELVGQDEDKRKDGLRAIRADEAFTGAEIGRLIEHADKGLYQSLFATVAATGLRPEEAYALKWPDLELDNARLFVRRSLSWARGTDEKGPVRPKFYPPKTKAGTRTLPLPAGLISVLRVWKLQCPKSENDLVFSRTDGKPLHRSNVLRQGLYPALRRAGLRGANVKTLRHSYASGLIAAGAPVTEVTRLMGHSNPAVTLKVYSHWFKDVSSGATDRFAKAFLPAPEKSGHKVGTKAARLRRPEQAKLAIA
jgi:integrase